MVSVSISRLTQTYFALVRDAPAHDDPDYLALMIARHVLGGHFFSRLNVALRHEGGETYGASASLEGGPERGMIELATYTRSENAEATENKLRDVLKAFHAKGITEEERKQAAGYLVGSRPFGRQSPGQIASRHLAERRLGLSQGHYDGMVDRAAKLSLDQVNAFIKEFFDPRAFTLIEVVKD